MDKLKVRNILDKGTNFYDSDLNFPINKHFRNELEISKLPENYNLLIKSVPIKPNLYKKNAIVIYTVAEYPKGYDLLNLISYSVSDFVKSNEIQNLFDKYDVEPFIANLELHDLDELILLEFPDENGLSLPIIRGYDKYGEESFEIPTHIERMNLSKYMANLYAIEFAVEELVDYISKNRSEFTFREDNKLKLDIEKLVNCDIKIFNKAFEIGHISETIFYNKNLDPIISDFEVEVGISNVIRSCITLMDQKELKYFGLPYHEVMPKYMF
jgi:hypothetical protein